MEQELIYRDLWLEKIEIPSEGRADHHLDAFLKTKGFSSLEDTDRSISELEQQIRIIISSKSSRDTEDEDEENKEDDGRKDVDLSGMILFSRFHSFLFSLDLEGDEAKIDMFVQQFSKYFTNI